IATGGSGFNADENVSFAQLTVATFTDPGGAEAVDNYGATINWGDGSAVEAGPISFDLNTTTFSVISGHTYVEEGTFTVSVTVTHLQAPPAVANRVVTVADRQ